MDAQKALYAWRSAENSGRLRCGEKRDTPQSMRVVFCPHCGDCEEPCEAFTEALKPLLKGEVARSAGGVEAKPSLPQCVARR